MIKVDDITLEAVTKLGARFEFGALVKFLESERIRLAIERKNDSSDYVQDLVDLFKGAEDKMMIRQQVKKESSLYETGVI